MKVFISSHVALLLRHPSVNRNKFERIKWIYQRSWFINLINYVPYVVYLDIIWLNENFPPKFPIQTLLELFRTKYFTLLRRFAKSFISRPIIDLLPFDFYAIEIWLNEIRKIYTYYRYLYRFYRTTNFCISKRNLFFLFNSCININIFFLPIFFNLFRPIIFDLNLSLPIWSYRYPTSPSLLFFLFLSFTSCPPLS